MAASHYISKLLTQKGHNVTVKKAGETKLSEFDNYDFILLGTPSWLERDEEGQPHENFIRFMEDYKDVSIKPNKCAVFGLGDETYAHFGRGADILGEFLVSKGCTLITKPFKIDSYYVNPDKHQDLLTSWINELPL